MDDQKPRTAAYRSSSDTPDPGDSPAPLLVRSGETVTSAYAQLRDIIMEGELTPGQRLTQNALATRLRVGRTPLREALRMLEADGFVVSTAHSGMTVASPQLGAAEELYAARLLLEPPILSGLVGRLEAADLDAMGDELAEMESIEHRYRDFQSAHARFHLVAFSRSGAELTRLQEDLYRRVVWIQRVYMGRVAVARDFIELDRLLLAAIRAGDAKQAKRLQEFHVIDAAIGMALDIDPDHAFGPLVDAARGIGITIVTGSSGRIAPPTTIAWDRPLRGFPALETANGRTPATGAS